MVEVNVTVDIARPPEEVFAYLSDPRHLHEWQGGVIESRQEGEGPINVGTRITDVRKFLGKRIESTVEITGYDEGKQLELKVISGPIPFNLQQRLEPVEGGTRVLVHAEGEPGGFFRFAENMVARQAQRQFENDYATLKDVLEAG